MKYKNLFAMMLCTVILLSFFACSKGGDDLSESESLASKSESSLVDESIMESEKNEESVGDEISGDSEIITDKKPEEKPGDETSATEEVFQEETEIDTFTPSVEFLESCEGAALRTADGLYYLADGYEDVKNDRFIIYNDFIISFPSKKYDEFNRITLCYISSAPLKCTVSYFVGEEYYEDSFFLEAGTNIFSGLIGGYLEGVCANSLRYLSFEVLEGEPTEFMVYNVVCSERNVYNEDTYYLENDRYKVGLRLIWGGGICYIEDKACEVPKIRNLINIHDAGRLVQQSYYGTTGNDEYKPGYYNGTNWVYNPVQGGDQYWNKSRLIDIIVKKDSVYIKAQPQDWSLDNVLTPSYMENTYTVYSDRIEVDNRFVDFSGWEHRFAHQELPAFYTVSYLDSFTYYNGLSPWTDSELIRHDGLPFSGGEERDQCYFKFLSGNTETWCAWTNIEDDFGIGLYTPNADLVLAGRFLDGHSKDPRDNTCSYVAPVNTLMIKSFKPIEYSYMITTGKLENIRATFKKHKDFATNDYLTGDYSQDIRLPDISVSYENISFATAEHNKYLTVLNNATVKFSSTYNAVELAPTGADPQINILYGNSPQKLSAKDYGKIVIEYMVPASNSAEARVGEVFLCTGNTVNAEGEKSVAFSYVADGKWHALEIDVSSLDFWSGRINSVRFDFFNAGSLEDKIFVRSIRLVK